MITAVLTGLKEMYSEIVEEQNVIALDPESSRHGEAS